MGSGKSDELKGRVKEAAGALTDNKKLKREMIQMSSSVLSSLHARSRICHRAVVASAREVLGRERSRSETSVGTLR